METEYSPHLIILKIFKSFHVRKKSELFHYLKSRRINSNICINPITTNDYSYSFPDHNKDSDSLMCEECLKDVLLKYPNISYTKKKQISGYCDCGYIESFDSKVFCSKHQGNFQNENEINDFINRSFSGEISQIPSQLEQIIEMLNMVIVTLGDKYLNDIEILSDEDTYSEINENNNSNNNNNNSESNDTNNEIENSNNTIESLQNETQNIDNDESFSLDDINITHTFYDEININDDLFTLFNNNNNNKENNIILNSFPLLEKETSQQFPSFTKSNISSLTKNQLKDIANYLLTFISDMLNKSLNLGIALLLGKLFSHPTLPLTTHVCYSSITCSKLNEPHIHECICSPIQNLIRYTNVFEHNLVYLKQNYFTHYANVIFMLMKSEEFIFELTFSCLVHFSNYLTSSFQYWYTANLVFIYQTIPINKIMYLVNSLLTSAESLMEDMFYWTSQVNMPFIILLIMKKLFLFNKAFDISNDINMYKQLINCIKCIQFSMVFVYEYNEHECDGYSRGDYAYTELYYLNLFALFIKQLNYDNETNVFELIRYIYDYIKEFHYKIQDNNAFSFSIPLHRCLSMLLNRFLLYRTVIANKKKSFNDNVKEVLECFEICKDNIIIYLLQPIMQCAHLVNGIPYKMWEHYKDNMKYYTLMYYNYSDIFYLCDLNLTKIIFIYLSYTYPHTNTVSPGNELHLKHILCLCNTTLCSRTLSLNNNNNNSVTESEYNVMNKDLQFICRVIKNEEFVVDLLLYPYIFYIEKRIECPNDVLYTKCKEYNIKQFNYVFKQRLQNIIIANNNCMDLSTIIDYLPFYYKAFGNEIESILDSEFDKKIIQNKIHYSSLNENHVDILAVNIKGLIKGIKKHFVNRNKPIIKSTKIIKYDFISSHNDNIFINDNLSFLIDYFITLYSTEVNEHEYVNKKQKSKHKLMILLLHVIGIFIREMNVNNSEFINKLDVLKNSIISNVNNQKQNELHVDRLHLACEYIVNKIMKIKVKNAMNINNKIIYSPLILTSLHDVNVKVCVFCYQNINTIHDEYGILWNIQISKTKIKQIQYNIEYISLESCFHLAHGECFENCCSLTENKCPLCKHSFNILLPSILITKNKYNNINHLIDNFIHKNKTEIKNMLYCQSNKPSNNKPTNITDAFIIRLLKIFNNAKYMHCVSYKDIKRDIKDVYKILFNVFVNVIRCYMNNIHNNNINKLCKVFISNYINNIRAFVYRHSEYENEFVKLFLNLYLKVNDFITELNVVQFMKNQILFDCVLYEIDFLFLSIFNTNDNNNTTIEDLNNIHLDYVRYFIVFYFINYSKVYDTRNAMAYWNTNKTEIVNYVENKCLFILMNMLFSNYYEDNNNNKINLRKKLEDKVNNVLNIENELLNIFNIFKKVSS